MIQKDSTTNLCPFQCCELLLFERKSKSKKSRSKAWGVTPQAPIIKIKIVGAAHTRLLLARRKSKSKTEPWHKDQKQKKNLA